MMDELFTADDQRLLDRLVDCELSDGERRALLQRLEHAPDGWRRCALAFLEAQAWRGEVRALTTEPALLPQPSSIALRGRQGASVWLGSALAAGLLVAVSWSMWNGVKPDVPQGLGGVAPGVPIVAAPSAPAGQQNLRLVVNQGPDGRQNVVEVPLVDAARMNEVLFGQWNQALSPEMMRVFEQNGHQIVRERRLMPVDLHDGRRVVVPMDQVEIQPVGLQSFQ